MKKMKYFIAGTLVGAVVMTAGSAIAAEVKQLVGTKVGSVWELHVDGEKAGEVPIINGSSYGPIRQIAEIAGMDVDFEPGKVFLETAKEGGGNVEVGEKTQEVLTSEISTKKVQLQAWKDKVVAHEESIRDVDSPENVAVQEAKIVEAKGEIAALEAEIVDLEAQLAALNAE